MSELTPPRPAKPGTACLGCRRRKLKCSREPNGCSNCTKADLPCVYPAPEPGIKRKRGPYKKDKPARERHLEDLVRYLEPKSSVSIGAEHSSATSSPRENIYGSSGSGQGSVSIPSQCPDKLSQANSEDLVKDALIALTKSCISETKPNSDLDASALPYRTAPSQGLQSGFGIPHPPVQRILEYWNLFTARVDPLMKIIHSPTFSKKLFSSLSIINMGPGNVPASFELMLFTIYFAAVRSCIQTECKKKFGESQDTMLQLYGGVVESMSIETLENPELESLQAVIIYLTCVRRHSDGKNSRRLYRMAVQVAQHLGLHEDPGDAFSPFETEQRRRLWWATCALESRGAKDDGTRPNTIMLHQSVKLPANLNDNDLDPNAKVHPHPREGITQTTWTLLRLEIQRFVLGLLTIRRRFEVSSERSLQNDATVRAEQEKMYQETKVRIETAYIQYLNDSRPFDWMCATYVLGMLIKARTIIDYPEGFMPCKVMPIRDRMTLLQLSVDIIQGTHMLGTDERVQEWSWYYRGFVQWNSFAIILGELGQNTSQEFSDTAWAVVGPILANWDVAYDNNRGDPSWDHVNAMIQRARTLRRQKLAAKGVTATSTELRELDTMQRHPTANLLADPMTARLSLRLNPQQFTPFGTSFASPLAQTEHLQSHVPDVIDPLTSNSLTVSSGASYADIDGMLDGFDGMDDINFEAFDDVFGDGSWAFSGEFESEDMNDIQFG